MEYLTPHVTPDDCYQPDSRAWINLFGQENLFTTRERVAYILDINHSSFQEDSGFSDHILELFEVPYLGKDMSIENIPARVQYEKNLTTHDLLRETNIHHLIFQNKNLHGHKTTPDNQISLARWLHSSFHKLLNMRDFYPHEQISQFLKREQEYLNKSFIERIRQIEQSYSKAFYNNPLDIYKRECFSAEFHRKIRR